MAPKIIDVDNRHKDAVIFWLSLALIIVSVAFTGTVIYLVAKCYSRRRQRYQTVSKGEEKSPPVPGSRVPWAMQRVRTLEDRVEDEENQREFMIRKSYAGRASLRTSSQLSQYSNDGDMEAAAGDAASLGLKDDYKDWEAKLHEERCRSPENHPGLVRPLNVEVDLGVRNVVRQEPPPPISKHPMFARRQNSNESMPPIAEIEFDAQAPEKVFTRSRST